jgi:NADPH2:quinone reductase
MSPSRKDFRQGSSDCDYVIDYRKEDFATRVKEITKGEGCHVVYDGVARRLSRQRSIACDLRDIL